MAWYPLRPGMVSTRRQRPPCSAKVRLTIRSACCRVLSQMCIRDSYWGLARLRAAAAYGTSAPGRTVVRVPAPASEGTPGLRPAELDRLFQRDARRYDGRFTLF